MPILCKSDLMSKTSLTNIFVSDLFSNLSTTKSRIYSPSSLHYRIHPLSKEHIKSLRHSKCRAPNNQIRSTNITHGVFCMSFIDIKTTPQSHELEADLYGVFNILGIDNSLN